MKNGRFRFISVNVITLGSAFLKINRNKESPVRRFNKMSLFAYDKWEMNVPRNAKDALIIVAAQFTVAFTVTSFFLFTT